MIPRALSLSLTSSIDSRSPTGRSPASPGQTGCITCCLPQGVFKWRVQKQAAKDFLQCSSLAECVGLHFLTTLLRHSIRADRSSFVQARKQWRQHSHFGFKIPFMSHQVTRIKNKKVSCPVALKLNTRKAFVFQNSVT